MPASIRSLVTLMFALAATPILANPGTTPSSVDEPAALVLLGIGVAGLIIGRRMAQRRD